MINHPTFNLWYAVIAVLIVFALQDVFFGREHIKAIPYSEFQQAPSAGQISEVNIGPTSIEGAYKNPA